MASSEKSSSVLHVTSLGPPVSCPRRLIPQVTLRISAIVFTMVAISVMVASSQTVVVFGFQFQAHYFYSTAFKFLVGANAAVCACSALSLTFFLSPSLSQELKNYFFLFLHDTVMLVLITSGCAAATAIGYVGQHGENHMSWQPTCGYVSKFCNRMTIALVFSYLALFAYLLLALISAHNLMSRPAE